MSTMFHRDCWLSNNYPCAFPNVKLLLKNSSPSSDHIFKSPCLQGEPCVFQAPLSSRGATCQSSGQEWWGRMTHSTSRTHWEFTPTEPSALSPPFAVTRSCLGWPWEPCGDADGASVDVHQKDGAEQSPFPSPSPTPQTQYSRHCKVDGSLVSTAAHGPASQSLTEGEASKCMGNHPAPGS